MHWAAKIGLGFVVIVVVTITLFAAVLALPVFSGLRTSVATQVLSEKVGHPVIVEEDVSVRLGRTAHFKAYGVRVTTDDMPRVNEAELDRLDIDIDLLDLLRGRYDLDNLIMDGLRLSLALDGTRKTSEKPGDGKEDETDGERQILAFLRTRTVDVTNIDIFVKNLQTGFELDFQLDALALDQREDGAALEVAGAGVMNDQSFELAAYFPDEKPFTVAFDFSTATLRYDGVPSPGGYDNGYTAQLSLEVTELSDFFDALRLRAEMQGTATFGATVSVSPERTKISALTADVSLAGGQYLGVTGGVENLQTREGIDLSAQARLFPEASPPPPAETFGDLKVTEVTATIRGGAGIFELDEFLIKTNHEQEALDELGPVTIGRVYRQDDGRLSVEDFFLQAGPRDAPILVVSGDIMSVLEFKDISLEGELVAPASLLLARLGDDVADTFGKVEASFALDDTSGSLSLANFTAHATDSEIWTLDARAKATSVTQLDGLEVDIELGLPDGASFLSALQLEPVETGPFTFSTSLRGKSSGATADLGLQVQESDLHGSIELDTSAGKSSVDAAIVSERMDINEVKTGLAAVQELLKLRQSAGSDAVADAEDGRAALQPLVLPTEEPSAADLMDPVKILAETDGHASLELQQISGVPGLTSLTSEMVLEDGKARLGPLDVAFAGGFLNFDAAMDLIETPHLVSLSGSIGGWDLADVLKIAGVDFQASGALSGNFSLRGNRTSVDSFLNTMYGRAEMDLSEGQVASSLLELAGLGIFPWLFSEERRQGYTDVVCVQAPVSIAAGRLEFDSVVAETLSVQMVAEGYVDWNADQIALRAEPRPVGRPLARAAWPFDVTGKLSDPKFKLDIGGERERRADGADEMPENRVPCRPDIFQLQ